MKTEKGFRHEAGKERPKRGKARSTTAMASDEINLAEPRFNAIVFLYNTYIF